MRNQTRLAGLLPRALALLVDLLAFCAVFFPATRLLKGVWLMRATDHRWNQDLFVTDPLCLGFLLVMFLYFVLLEGLAGATVGKMVVGIRVERAGGGAPGLQKGLLRNLLRVVDSLPALGILGIILIATSPERARFGDRVAGTRVMRTG